MLAKVILAGYLRRGRRLGSAVVARARISYFRRRVMDYPIKTVCVVGLGYIGLPTAATLPSRGLDVIGVDINPRVVATRNAGQTSFSEPHLDTLPPAPTTFRSLPPTPHPD